MFKIWNWKSQNEKAKFVFYILHCIVFLPLPQFPVIHVGLSIKISPHHTLFIFFWSKYMLVVFLIHD